MTLFWRSLWLDRQNGCRGNTADHREPMGTSHATFILFSTTTRTPHAMLLAGSGLGGVMFRPSDTRRYSVASPRMYAIAPAPLSSAAGQNPAGNGPGGDRRVSRIRYGGLSRPAPDGCMVYNGHSPPSCTLLFRWLISTLVSPHFPLRASPRCFVRTHCAPSVSATNLGRFGSR